MLHRENLLKLADYLDTVDGLHFNMRSFHSATYEPYGPDATAHPCGTTACAIGYGPSAGIPAETLEHWDDYSWRVFIDERDTPETWSWCFDFDWAETDNTPKGAAKRIRYLLDGNDVPANWRDIMGGLRAASMGQERGCVMDAQEIFNTVCDHLMKQGRKAMMSHTLFPMCRYRTVQCDTGETLKCAVGILIPDDVYSEEMEGRIWTDLIKDPDLERHFEAYRGHYALIRDLQLVHDGVYASEWPRRLLEIADDRGLELPASVKKRL